MKWKVGNMGSISSKKTLIDLLKLWNFKTLNFWNAETKKRRNQETKKLVYFHSRESQPPLNITTPTPAPAPLVGDTREPGAHFFFVQKTDSP